MWKRKAWLFCCFLKNTAITRVTNLSRFKTQSPACWEPLQEPLMIITRLQIQANWDDRSTEVHNSTEMETTPSEFLTQGQRSLFFAVMVPSGI